jgi:hypothetical protein
MTIDQLNDLFIEQEYSMIKDFVKKVFNDDYISFYDFLEKKMDVSMYYVTNFFMEEIPQAYLQILYNKNPQSTIDYVVDEFLTDVKKEGDKYYMIMSRDDLSEFFDDRGRDGTARDVAKRVLSDEPSDWYNNDSVDVSTVVEELDEGNFDNLLHKFFVEHEGEEYDGEIITQEFMKNTTKNELSDMISKLDDELSSNLTSLYSTAEYYAYEEEIYNLVNRELKDFFGTEKWGDYITSQIKKIDGTIVNKETFRVDVTNLLKRIVPEYINMHVTEPDNQFEYQANLENVIQDWFNETEDYLDFRVPEYPDYRLLEKQINDLYSDYI